MDDAHLGEVIGEAVVIVDDDHRPPVVLHQRRAGDQRQTASLALGFLRGTSVDGRDDAATVCNGSRGDHGHAHGVDDLWN